MMFLIGCYRHMEHTELFAYSEKKNSLLINLEYIYLKIQNHTNVLFVIAPNYKFIYLTIFNFYSKTDLEKVHRHIAKCPNVSQDQRKVRAQMLRIQKKFHSCPNYRKETASCHLNILSSGFSIIWFQCSKPLP